MTRDLPWTSGPHLLWGDWVFDMKHLLIILSQSPLYAAQSSLSKTQIYQVHRWVLRNNVQSLNYGIRPLTISLQHLHPPSHTPSLLQYHPPNLPPSPTSPPLSQENLPQSNPLHTYSSVLRAFPICSGRLHPRLTSSGTTWLGSGSPPLGPHSTCLHNAHYTLHSLLKFHLYFLPGNKLKALYALHVCDPRPQDSVCAQQIPL